MRVLIFAGQAPFGTSLAQIVNNQTGLDAAYGVNLESGSAKAQEALEKVFVSRLTDLVNDTSVGSVPKEYVLLMDSYTSRAYVLACAWAETCGRDVLIIAGANVPMGMDAFYLKEDVDTLQELEKSLLAEGKAGMLGTILERSPVHNPK